MRDRSSLDRSIGQDSHVIVHEKMSMGSTTLVMTWEDGLERNHTIGVGRLDAAEVSRIPAIFSDVAGLINTGVDTCGVCVPDINIQAGRRKTGGDVEILDLEVQRDSCLAFGNVLSDALSCNVVGAVSNFRRQDARGVGAEDSSFGGLNSVVVQGCGVVVDGFVHLEGCKVTTKFLGLCG